MMGDCELGQEKSKAQSLTRKKKLMNECHAPSSHKCCHQTWRQCNVAMLWSIIELCAQSFCYGNFCK